MSTPPPMTPPSENPGVVKSWLHDWRFAVVALFLSVMVLVGLGWFQPTAPLSWLQTLLDNLPLTLPILSVVLSTLVNIRELGKPYGWIRLPTALSLGLVSFAIWYQVTALNAPDPVIRISATKYLVKDYGMLFLVVSFIWATLCAMAKVLAESTPEANRHIRWHASQAILLVLSGAALGLPFFLFEPEGVLARRLNLALNERFYSVSIAYRDPALAQHLGVTEEEIIRCYTYKQLRAASPDDAVRKAIESFHASPRSAQFIAPARRGKEKPPGEVTIVDAWIVVGREPGIPMIEQQATASAESQSLTTSSASALAKSGPLLLVRSDPGSDHAAALGVVECSP